MTKIEMINGLTNCISIMQNTDNIYVTRTLETIAESLVKEWSDSDVYYEEIKNVLMQDETYNNLNNIKL